MKTISIILQDTPSGTVKWRVENLDEILAKNKSGHELTPAEGFAVLCANVLLHKGNKEYEKFAEARKSKLDLVTPDGFRL